jgi:hypothetical protein
MHTTTDLSSSSFSIRVDGTPGDIESVFAGFSDRDRLGVVVREPCGAVGASTLILAAITAYYDVWKARAADFFIYRDYFLFHAGRLLGDHGQLDIWPSHKEVVVEDDAEQLLRAINDRGVTRLLVPDRDSPNGAPGSDLERESLASAHDRIVTALAYDAGGRVAGADVRIAGNGVTEDYVQAVIERSAKILEFDRPALEAARRGLAEDGSPVESYRRIGLEDALSLL